MPPAPSFASSRSAEPASDSTNTSTAARIGRVALFGAALEKQDYNLLWEAMQDRLHQGRRAQLVPGLAEALAVRRVPGLIGIALSGSGPSVVALATEDFEVIAGVIAKCFHKHKLETTVRVLEVDHLGLRTSMATPIERNES